MFIYFLSFLASFFAVGIKGFQHKNVIGNHRWSVFFTSFLIAACGVAEVKLILQTGWLVTITAGAGAAFGMIAAMFLHDKIFKRTKGSWMITAEELRQRKTEHAKLTIKLHGQGMSYDEAVEQGEKAKKELEGMNPLTNPLYRFVLKRQNRGYEVAAAISWLKESDQTAHLREVHALVKSVDGVGIEVNALVSKSNSDGMLKSAVLCYFFEQQIFAGITPGHSANYEVVIL